MTCFELLIASTAGLSSAFWSVLQEYARPVVALLYGKCSALRLVTTADI